MWPIITPDHHEAAQRVLDSGRLTDGREVARFEERFAAEVGAEYAVMCSSGTTAIHAALLAAELVRRDDRVAVPALTFAGTVLGADMQRHMIDWKDCDVETGNVEHWTNDEAWVAITVHLHGNAAPVPIKQYGFIIEDCAQAFGTLDESGRQVGYLGHCAAWSLNETKTMWAGEGGVLTTDDEGLADTVRQVIRFGGTHRDTWRAGSNWKPDEMRAALGSASLDHVRDWIDHARTVGDILDRALTGTPFAPLRFVGTPNRHKYRVRLDGRMDRDETIELLRSRGVDAATWMTLALTTMRRWHPFGGDRATTRAQYMLDHSLILGDERCPLAAVDPDDVRRWIEVLNETVAG